MTETATVLVVDDDPAVGMVLRAILAQAGCDALLAESVQRGLALLRARSIDLVISDLRMPGEDGFGMLEALKQNWPDVPLIMLTAHGSVPLAVAAMRAGAADFLLKPFGRTSDPDAAPVARSDAGMSLEDSVGIAERTAISTAIRQAGGNRTQAARLLGISRRSLYNKIAEYGIEDIG